MADIILQKCRFLGFCVDGNSSVANDPSPTQKRDREVILVVKDDHASFDADKEQALRLLLAEYVEVMEECIQIS